MTGTVVPPAVEFRPNRLIVVTFRVLPEHSGQAGGCQGNNSVPYEVALGEPIGDRVLLDGRCVSDAEKSSYCYPRPAALEPSEVETGRHVTRPERRDDAGRPGSLRFEHHLVESAGVVSQGEVSRDSWPRRRHLPEAIEQIFLGQRAKILQRLLGLNSELNRSITDVQ